MCYAANHPHRSDNELSFEEISDLAEQARKLGVVSAQLTGGEPTLRPDLDEIVALFAKFSVVQITCNSLLLDRERLQRLKKAGLHFYNLSLDATNADENDYIRGCPGHFEKVLTSLQIIKSMGMQGTVSFTLHGNNVEKLKEIIDFSKKYNVHVAASPQVPISRAADQIDNILTEESWNRICEIDTERKVHFDFMTYSSSKLECPAGHERMCVNAYGDVSGCTVNPVSFGNIRDITLAEIWNAIRQFPEYNKNFPYCQVAWDEDYIRKYIQPVADSKELPVDIEQHPTAPYDTGRRKPDEYTCRVCGHDRADYDRSGHGATLLKCRQCGHGQLHPFPAMKEVAEAYQGSDDKMGNAYAFMMLEGYLKNKKRFYRFLSSRVRRFAGLAVLRDKAGRILDVGCSSGFFLALLRDYHGFKNLTGVDITRDAVERGSRDLNLDLRMAESPDALVGEDPFHAVHICHVLEHIDNPLVYMQNLRKVMASNGEVLIEVPNLHGLAGQLMGEHWHWYLVPHHLHYFTEESLALTLEKAGFENVVVHPRTNTSTPGAYTAEILRTLVALFQNRRLPDLISKPYSDMNAWLYKGADLISKVVGFPLYFYMSRRKAHSVLVAHAYAPAVKQSQKTQELIAGAGKSV